MARKKSSEKICITFFKKIQSNAIKRGLSFDLDIDYLWDLFLKQNKKCALTKVDINIVNATISYNYHLNTASLDRIDSSKGYEKDNIRWVHKAINHIKSDIDDTNNRIRQNNIIMNRQKDTYTKINKNYANQINKEKKIEEIDTVANANIEMINKFSSQNSYLNKLYPAGIFILAIVLIYISYITFIKFRDNIWMNY